MTNGSTAYITNIVDVFIGGGNINSMTVNSPTILGNSATWNSDNVITISPASFNGAAPIIEQYLYGMENSIFGAGTAPSSIPAAGGNTTLTVPASITSAQETALVENSDIPIIELMKMAYVNQQPELISQASKLIATEVIYRWIHSLMFALDLAAGAKYDLNKKKGKVAAINIRTMKATFNTVLSELRVKHDTYKKQVITEMDKLNALNKAWVTGLANSGLSGNYNFSVAN
ncbi:MAG: hypothetical protein ACYCTD_04895 [bacterium]